MCHGSWSLGISLFNTHSGAGFFSADVYLCGEEMTLIVCWHATFNGRIESAICNNFIILYGHLSVNDAWSKKLYTFEGALTKGVQLKLESTLIYYII